MDVLERVQTRMTDDSVDTALLTEYVQTIIDRICMRLGVGDMPRLAESIAVDATVKMYNRRFYEGITSESDGHTGSISTAFVDDILAEYAEELDQLKRMHFDDDGTVTKDVVRFL